MALLEEYRQWQEAQRQELGDSGRSPPTCSPGSGAAG